MYPPHPILRADRLGHASAAETVDRPDGAEHDGLDVFFQLIIPHGLLELSAVFVAAGAGLRLFWVMLKKWSMFHLLQRTALTP